MLRRGHKLYYRYTVPVDSQSLLDRLEIWRSLHTDSLSVALRRLPVLAGLPIDAILIRPLDDDLAEDRISISAVSLPTERSEPGSLPACMAILSRVSPVPGQPLHERHWSIVIQVRLMVDILLQDDE